MPDQIHHLKSALADRYTIQRELGAGGMATVYLARDIKHGREVAVKVLRPELAAALGADRFLREIAITAGLNHPHILPLLDSGEADGFLFYAMPYVDGESLRERLDREKQLPLPEAIRLTSEIADALASAHRRDVLHRDIKPENILLKEGHAVVADFGIARAMNAAGGDRLTETGLAVGTPQYMSPEQMSGEVHLAPSSDVYSLACVTYEMLAGEPPFTGATVQALLARKAAGSVPSLRDVRSGVPQSVEDAICKALARVPSERFATALDFAAALSTAEAEAPRRSRLAAKMLVSFGLLAGVVVGGWHLLGGGEPAVTDRSIAVLPFETLGEEKTNAFTDGIHGDLLTRLSHISDLSVISRTSVMRYRNPEKPLPAIAAELGVAWILHGEVQEAADQVQVNARLVNARTDRQVWAESYRRELTAANLFQIQAEITKEIARALEAHLSPQEERQVERTPTENLDSYRLYAQGRGQLDQRTEQGMRRALDYFQRAIADDSSYALAWAGLADGLSLLEFYGYPTPGIALGPRQAARRALELDPTLGEAHASLGIVHSTRREGPEAVRELERAVELRPGYAEAHSWLGWMHLILGRPEEALEPMKRAATLSPLAPAFRAYLAEAYLANGRSRDALREARRAREIQPDYPLAHFIEGLVLYHLGMMAEAKAVLRDVLPVVRPGGTPSLSEVRAVLAVTHAASGDSTNARELLARIEEANHPFSAGLVHAALGEYQAAFDAFARVPTWDSFSTEHFRYFFPDVLGPLRDDPRYQELLRAVDRRWGLDPDGGR